MSTDYVGTSFVLNNVTDDHVKWWYEATRYAELVDEHRSDGKDCRASRGSFVMLREKDFLDIEAHVYIEGADGIPELKHEGGSLYVFEEMSADVELIAVLTYLWLRRFELDDVIAFTWARWSSKPRPDSFSGGAVVITRHQIRYEFASSVVDGERRSTTR